MWVLGIKMCTAMWALHELILEITQVTFVHDLVARLQSHHKKDWQVRSVSTPESRGFVETWETAKAQTGFKGVRDIIW